MTGPRESDPASAERFAAARRLFELAAAAAPEARCVLLADARRDDPELCDEVEGMLRHHERSDGLLDRAPAELVGLDGSDRGSGSELPVPTLRDSGQPLAPGVRIAGYTLTRTIASGGLGVVYEAERASTAGTVALKLIHAELVTAEMVRRFRHESGPLIPPAHPGLARVHEIGVATIDGHDRPLVAMELVRGPTLAEFARQLPLSTRQKILLVAAVADAVQHAHDAGLDHGDLTPGRVLVALDGPAPAPAALDAAGRSAKRRPPPLPPVKLVGFGLTRLTGPRDPAPAAPNASPAAALAARAAPASVVSGYAAPEVVAGERGTNIARADVYAIGAILCELLTGRPHGALERLNLPGRLGGGGRADLEAVLRRAVAANPANRYARAADLAADLRRWVAGEPVLARPPTRLGALWRRRRPWIIGAMAVVATLLGALVKGLMQP